MSRWKLYGLQICISSVFTMSQKFVFTTSASKSLIFKMYNNQYPHLSLSTSLPSSMTKVHTTFLSHFQRVTLDCIHARSSTHVSVKIIPYFLFQMFGYCLKLIKLRSKFWSREKQWYFHIYQAQNKNQHSS
jgi:hypothetical protein